MFAALESDRRHLMMQGVRRKVVDGVDRPVGDHFPVVGVDAHVDSRLEIAEKFVADGQRVAGKVAASRPLRRALAAPDVHRRIVVIAGTERGNLKIVDAGFPQQPVAA